MNSILDTVKSVVGSSVDDDSFNTDVLIFTNMALGTLTQLGVGPSTGFSITGSTETWVDFLGDTKLLESVKAYVCIEVRLLFDAPTNSSVLESLKAKSQELVVRIRDQAEEIANETVAPA